MTKTVLLILLCSFSLFAQDDSIRNISFKYYDYEFRLTSNNNQFFAGHLEVNKDGIKIYQWDSNFTDYISHNIVDLDGDGSKELLLSLTEGASPYVYNVLYLFDIKKGIKPLYIMNNGELNLSKSNEPKIGGYSRMSPSVLGLGYIWLWEYKYGKLRLLKTDENPWKLLLEPDEKSLLENLTQYEDFSEKCSDGVYNTFFETLFIQYKIAGDDKSAEKFFKKHYKCPGKEKALEQVKNAAADTYSWLRDESNFKYIEE